LYLGILTGQWRGISGWFAFGFVSGLGMWFCYTTAISFSACILCLLLLKGFPRKNEALSIFFGFFLGLLPWFYYNLKHHFAGISRIFEMFGYGDPIDPWITMGHTDKLIRFFSEDFPLGMITPYTLPLPNGLTVIIITIFCLFLYSMLILSIISISRAFVHKKRPRSNYFDFLGVDEKQKELVFVVYIILFIFVFVFSSLTIDRNLPLGVFRLFTPFVVILFIPLSITVVNTFKRGNKWLRHISAFSFSLFLISTMTATLALAIRTPDKNQQLSVNMGYTYMGYLLNRKYENNMERTSAIVDRVDKPDIQQRIWVGVGWGLEHRYEKNGNLYELQQKMKKIPCPAYGYLIEGIEFFGIESLNTAKHNHVKKFNDFYKKLHYRLIRLLAFMTEEKKKLEGDPNCSR